MKVSVEIEMTQKQADAYNAGEHILMTARFAKDQSNPVHALARTMPYPAVLDVEKEWVETLTANDPDNE